MGIMGLGNWCSIFRTSGFESWFHHLPIFFCFVLILDMPLNFSFLICKRTIITISIYQLKYIKLKYIKYIKI